MGLRSSSVFLIACFACLGLDHNLASNATPTQAVKGFKLAQVSSTDNVKISNLLEPGSTGTEVRTLQTLLKELGYYDGEIDGKYGGVTSVAVAKFQQARGLVADGVFGTVTKQNLEQNIQKKSLTPSVAIASNAISASTTTTDPVEKQDILWWLLVGMGTIGSLGALAYIIKGFSQVKKPARYIETSPQEHTNSVTPSRQEHTTTANAGYLRTSELVPPETVANLKPQLLSVEKTSRLAKVNIIEQLIEDLHSADPTQRRKAIWDLGQQGDSRAVQPLVELMVDADTQQRSLILAALAEIGTRTLKPMNRALAISLQDESPQVRKNAIRDLTRIYDMMAQVSQMVSHAMHDPDAEVQATAKYALSQMNRIRSLPSQEREDKTSDQ
ncbi:MULTISPECIES: peptidoglycan-binding protein [Nostocales]|uniref:Peptidoglycan-binding protein n=3 Tax=Nostocales TaxID=1161 RepID=A0A0C1N2T6_9CYAN|nr:peptidoglycan-binding protein [Tolypothrix bouteillei]KAF3885420.1 peptidoglycan-binding protein [Tolypothrix bouteillei VB521301]